MEYSESAKTKNTSPMKRFVCLALALVISACSEKRPSAAAATQIRHEISGTWPPAGYVKVVGHRFKSDNPEGFSFLAESAVDLTRLRELSAASAELTHAQIQQLFDATFQSEPGLPAAACYDPHHIFLFQDAAGQVTHAIEICFSCTNLHALPDLGEHQWQHHDFRRLYRLCEDLGLTDQPSSEYFQVWDERESP
jgi:hypothetical protein